MDRLARELQEALRLIRPLGRVLQHCIEDDAIGSDCTTYLRDVQDHYEQLNDDLRSQEQLCRSLIKEHEHVIDVSENRILYVLTVTTTIFLPGQVRAVRVLCVCVWARVLLCVCVCVCVCVGKVSVGGVSVLLQCNVQSYQIHTKSIFTDPLDDDHCIDTTVYMNES